MPPACAIISTRMHAGTTGVPGSARGRRSPPERVRRRARHRLPGTTSTTSSSRTHRRLMGQGIEVSIKFRRSIPHPIVRAEELLLKKMLYFARGGDSVDERMDATRSGTLGHGAVALARRAGAEQAIALLRRSSALGAAAADEKPRAHEASAWLAAADRFALPDVCPRGAQRILAGEQSVETLDQRARRRDPGARSSSATARSSSRRPARCTARSPTRWRSTPRSCSAWNRLFPGRDYRRGHRQRSTITARRPSSTAAAPCSRST